MSGLLKPTDLDWALRVARREAQDNQLPYVWSDDDWQDALNATSFGDPLRPSYDPFYAAISFLLSPDTLNARRLGDVQETFQGTEAIVTHLKDLSQRLRVRFGASVLPVFSLWGP